MRITLALDDDLLSQARLLTGVQDESDLIREALKALIERQSARRLAHFGGSESELKRAPRRRAVKKPERSPFP